MKITITDLETLMESLMKIEDKEFGFSMTLKLVQIKREIQTIHGTLKQEKMKVIEKYGNTDDDGNLIFNDDGSVEFDEKYTRDLVNDLTEYYETDVELNIPKLNLDDFGNSEISPSVLDGLYPILEMNQGKYPPPNNE